MDIPLPFVRELEYNPKNLLSGTDVYILQELIKRSNFTKNSEKYVFGTYESNLRDDVINFQKGYSLKFQDGVFGAESAEKLLKEHIRDNYLHKYTEAKTKSLPDPYQYMVQINVKKDRKIETLASLFDKNMTKIHTFIARTKGQKDLNELSPNGNTPTGLFTFDFQTPVSYMIFPFYSIKSQQEDDPESYGKWNVNRFVKGLAGNAAITCYYNENRMKYYARNGLLMHTGEWKDWNTTIPMPDSHGCVHTHPQDAELIESLLLKMGVEPHKNTFGKLPYPFQEQGLISIQLDD